MADVKVRALRNGPYEVSGDVDVLDVAGAAYPPGDTPIYLCRCGQSKTKPFCDGSHKKVGFQAAETVGTKSS
jgi:3-phenylpropionate/trans-cinnamate dioxygenase ferredoxin subunit